MLILLVGVMGIIYFLESKAGLEFFPGLQQKYCRAHACVFITILGNSMNPTIQSNQRVLLVENYYSTNALAHGDIVQVASVINLGKRVIALPGDKLELREGVLYRNNTRLQEPYLLEPVVPSHYDKLMQELQQTGYVIPPNKVVVLGDNRNNSMDSGSLGLLSSSDITGKIVPFSWIDALFQKA